MQYFVTVAEELHFGRAATRLHIAQPSLSHQIRRLEQQFGVRLLERTSRRVALTAAGETLFVEGRRLLDQASRVASATRAATTEEITVGFAGSAATSLLAAVLRAFEDLYPAVRVSVRELLLDRVDDIRTGSVDLAFLRVLPGQTDLEVEVLTREPRMLAIRAGHPLATQTTVSFSALQNESFITNPIVEEPTPPLRWLREQHRHGLPGRVTAEAASIPEILTLVAAGRGVCLVPATVAQHFPRDDVRYLEVSDADPAVVSIAWSGPRRPKVEAFVKVAREIARQPTNESHIPST